MSEYDLEKLIQARKLRDHCKDWTVHAVLDEVVKLYNKYYLPEIQAADKEIARLKDALKPMINGTYYITSEDVRRAKEILNE